MRKKVTTRQHGKKRGGPSQNPSLHTPDEFVARVNPYGCYIRAARYLALRMHAGKSDYVLACIEHVQLKQWIRQSILITWHQTVAGKGSLISKPKVIVGANECLELALFHNIPGSDSLDIALGLRTSTLDGELGKTPLSCVLAM